MGIEKDKGREAPPELDEDGFPKAMTPAQLEEWEQRSDAKTLADLKKIAEAAEAES